MANSLIIPKQTRGTFANNKAAWVLLGLLVIVGVIVYVFTSPYNRAPLGTIDTTAGGPDGKATETRAAYDDTAAQPDTRAPDQTSDNGGVSVTRSGQSTAAPQRAQASTPSSSGSSSTSSSSTDTTARDDVRKRAQIAKQEADDRRAQLVAASMSLSPVTSPDAKDTAMVGQDPTEPQSGTTPTAVVPSGPILAIGTKIAVSVPASISSTFVGEVDATVTQDVKDERGQVVLIPAGSHCFAKSAQGGVDGQDRIFLSTDLCKRPDFSRVTLESLPAVDLDGATGLKARVDDHGAGRRNHGNSWMGLPGMLVGSVVPGAGAGIASTAIAGATQPSYGRAMPGPTLYVDASAAKPRAFYFIVTKDTEVSV